MLVQAFKIFFKKFIDGVWDCSKHVLYIEENVLRGTLHCLAQKQVKRKLSSVVGEVTVVDMEHNVIDNMRVKEKLWSEIS